MNAEQAVTILGNYVYKQLGFPWIQNDFQLLTDNIPLAIYGVKPSLNNGKKFLIKDDDGELARLVDAYNYFLYGKARKI